MKIWNCLINQLIGITLSVFLFCFTHHDGLPRRDALASCQINSSSYLFFTLLHVPGFHSRCFVQFICHFFSTTGLECLSFCMTSSTYLRLHISYFSVVNLLAVTQVRTPIPTVSTAAFVFASLRRERISFIASIRISFVG